MASFFQPPSSGGDPAVESCSASGFRVYCNRLLPTDHRLQHWSQRLNFVVAVVALGLPLVFACCRVAVWLWRRVRVKGTRKRTKSLPVRSHSSVSLSLLDSFKSIQSFRLRPWPVGPPDGNVCHDDLCVVDLWPADDGRATPPVRSSAAPSTTSCNSSILLGYVNLNHLGPSNLLLSAQLQDTVDLLAKVFVESSVNGLLLRPVQINDPDDARTDDFNALLEQLVSRHVPVLAICHHDDPSLPGIDLGLVNGLVIENACILEDGDRRDFFRSAMLRHMVSACSVQQKTRPSFFLGFLDLWHHQPLPAVVHRAFKLAAHFGARYEHGPMEAHGAEAASPNSLSSFKYLRRDETSQLQKAWIRQERSVHIRTTSDSPAPEIAHLDLDGLSRVLPDARGLLTAQSLSEQLLAIQTESPPLVDPPVYTDFLPQTEQFWDVSCNSEAFTPFGCFPIITGASQNEYDSVVETQAHLRDLNMLEKMEDAEVEKIIEQLRAFRIRTGHQDALEALIDSLTCRTTAIYVGLSTGFRVAESGAQFWGVSCANEDCIDIFVSKQAPSVLGTTLHVWLAASGVQRVARFEEEVRLDQMMNNSPPAHASGLPVSIRVEMERATPSEILFLLQRLRGAATGCHPLMAAIQAFGKHLLVDVADASAWIRAHSRLYLEGVVDMRQLLQMRLEKFARAGAAELPPLDNLVRLHRQVVGLVHQSLFTADRATLDALTDVLLHAYDPWTSWSTCEFVDVNADLFALIFFAALRRAALDDVYIETTDRCPFFLSQPDQAAVFAELWSVGSQSHGSFGILPRDLGRIIYDRYQAYLEKNPPPAFMAENGGLLSCYATPADTLEAERTRTARLKEEGLQANVPRSGDFGRIALQWRQRVYDFGVVSIFALPAMVDVLLLMFIGRGLFVTAYMDPDSLEMGCYALLIALLLAAGVTGWVGSVGGYYLGHYAYDNMILFHVQRLSSGFVLTVLVGLIGLVAFSVKRSVAAGFVFLAYLVAISLYLYILGIMATMHQRGSPFTSGRTVLWRTIPLLFISPVLSSLLNGHDLKIYLAVIYGFLIALLVQYRKLCHEWSAWLTKVPTLQLSDIEEWYSAKLGDTSSDSTSASGVDTTLAAEPMQVMAVSAFEQSVQAHLQRRPTAAVSDAFVARVAKGLPYAQWLLRKSHQENAAIPDLFTTTWFAELQQATKAQKQLSRGLKEHSIFMLFRFARFDVGQSVALFLICLMDHWVDVVTSSWNANAPIFIDFRARYGIGLCILYFCASIIALDATLYPYWHDRTRMSEDKLSDLASARQVQRQWEWHRRKRYLEALGNLFGKLSFILGIFTILLWLLVENPSSILLYWLYIIGYTGVMIFQFNRCFTTDVGSHLAVTYASMVLGFTTGCVLQTLPATRHSMFNNVLALDVAAVLAALLTSVWVILDFRMFKPIQAPTSPSPQHQSWQKRLTAGSAENSNPLGPICSPHIQGIMWITSASGVEVAGRITTLLERSLARPNAYTRATPWSEDLLHRALEAWLSGNIVFNIATRTDMINHGHEGISSFGTWDDGVLHITAGFLEEAETMAIQWQGLLSELLCECLLHHSTQALLTYGNAHAIQAEHFVGDNKYLSRRIDFELATVAPTELSAIQRNLRTVSEVLRHLCLDVDVDSCWEDLPPATRRVILSRVAGRPVPLYMEFSRWVETTQIDEQTIDFHLELVTRMYQRTLQRPQAPPISESPSRLLLDSGAEVVKSFAEPDSKELFFQRMTGSLVHLPIAAVKWIGILTGAASDVERELWFCLRTCFLRDKLLLVILAAWKVCCVIKNAWVYVLMIYHRSALAHISRLARKGASRVLKKNIIVVELPRKVVTGFMSKNEQGTLTLSIFPGRIETPPPGEQPSSVAVYDEHFRLKNRTDKVGTGKRICTYEYEDNCPRRWPKCKQVAQGSMSMRCHYDGTGRISHGTLTLASETFVFQYGYKTGEKHSRNILKADYRLEGSGSRNSLTIYWGSPARGDSMAKWTKCDWVPSDRVCCVMRFVDGKTYITTWEFLHRRDPIITSFLQEGDFKTVVTKVPRVFEEEDVLLVRPTHVCFDDDDLLVHHRPTDLRLAASATNKVSFLSRLNPLGWSYGLQKARYRRVPTWWLRSELWNHWLTTGNVDAVTACWMDEVILREEPLLKEYWRARDVGRLDKAKKALDDNIEQIVAAIEIEREVSEMCLLPIKASDLYVMGLSKDANQITNRPQDCFRDTSNRISVIFNDIGCWPEAPGGVSNCRRDLINGHSTIRNHVLAETANDYGIPRFQVEKSVQSLKLLPLWGVDGRTPNHGIIDNLLQSQVDDKIRVTDTGRDIIKTFIPLIKLFVRGARTKVLSRAQLQQYSQVFIALSRYFETKDYNTTWQSKEVMGAWVEAWLTSYYDPNVREVATLFDIERPSMKDFQDALAIYSSYFFIFSVEVPEECPRVFQSTHHGISSLFGLILKYRRGVTFGIWDHAILWRECCLNISPAQSSLSIPVQSMLLAGIGLATQLAYINADVILPCTPVFNPVWEAELGTDSGRLMHRNQFSRKIDPIINGISDMESFRLIDKAESSKPTVVMLSNVQFIKDIKTALLAADIIVNKFGFRDYKLLIYGAQDRQPTYAIEMSKLVKAYNLSDHVSLAGFASAQDALRSAWLFMNSSISEGLPLAIGEAALAGIPIVATEVGSTALVLTDPDDESLRYGEVVPPNDPMALARAQISILAMAGPWSRFTRDGLDAAASQASRHAVVLPDDIMAKDVEWLSWRMHEYSDDRRRLGLRARDVVLRSFHGKRYLREHEQMYWIQWHMARMRADGKLSQGARGLRYTRSQPMLRCSRESEEKANGEHSGLVRRHLRWQDFPEQERRVGKKLMKHRNKLVS